MCGQSSHYIYLRKTHPLKVVVSRHIIYTWERSKHKNYYNNNYSISKVQNLVCRDYFKRIHARTRTYTHRQTHARARTHTHARARMHTRTHAHTHTRTHTRTRTFAHMHAHMHARTHIHTQAPVLTSILTMQSLIFTHQFFFSFFFKQQKREF